MKEYTLGWLKQNQANGAFEGHPEDTMNFDLLDPEEIEWYYENWVKNDREMEV